MHRDDLNTLFSDDGWVMYLQAMHCPCCGGPLEVPEGAARVTCSYCQSSLVVDERRVTGHRASGGLANERSKVPPSDEPAATLYSREARRFEASIIEQRIDGVPADSFRLIELSDERFALVMARAVDADSVPLAVNLERGLAALQQSLEADSDPGLAANQALEVLCRGGFEARLEVTIALFEPKHMRVVHYSAGGADAVLWASTEEARCVGFNGRRDALERKHLRSAGDHFDNAEPIHLAAQDLILLPSAGFLGRGARGSSNSARALYDTVNAQLGAEPLRLVTLAKNAFWADFHEHRSEETSPSGTVRLAAVRAIPLPLVNDLPASEQTLRFSTRRFELAVRARPTDLVKLVPLHDERSVLIWFSENRANGPLDERRAQAGLDAVIHVLDRRDHGDNENPRRAGRDALAAMGADAQSMSVCVIQLFDAYERVKYFRAGFKQPIALGPRGRRADSFQAFDEGGEATVKAGARLFFPGQLAYDDQPGSLEALAKCLPGGKTSRLYEACVDHWKTKRSVAALELLVKAALSDDARAQTHGQALVTGAGVP